MLDAQKLPVTSLIKAKNVATDPNHSTVFPFPISGALNTWPQKKMPEIVLAVPHASWLPKSAGIASCWSGIQDGWWEPGISA